MCVCIMLLSSTREGKQQLKFDTHVSIIQSKVYKYCNLFFHKSEIRVSNPTIFFNNYP